MTKVLSKTVLSVGLLSLLVLSAVAQDRASSAQTQFQRGFFLQVHEHDLAGAAAEFEKVAADPAAPEPLRNQAKARLAQVREDMAAANLASLMPPQCMAYAEIVAPGEHIGRILKMMDLVGPGAAGGDKPAGKPIALGDGLYLPADFTISPALVAELKKFRGVAAGLTAVDDRGRPAGLLAIHPGDCDLLRGAIETGVQLLEPGEPIEGFKTYRIPDFGWVMLTARLVLVSDAREQLTAALERMRNPQAANLASSASFKRVAADSQGALVFAFVDGPQVVKRFGPLLRGQEGAMIRTLLDLDHFESLVVTLTTTDTSIRARAQLNLTSGHHNMLYALIRTAPITKRSLERVPKGAAGVLVVGLNPAGAAPPSAPDGQKPPSISAMDIGREFFNNIEELALFALAPAAEAKGPQKFPDVGLVVAVKDPAKSEALWNQILMLASLFGTRAANPPAEVTIEGRSGHVYQFDGLPPIAVVRVDRELIIGTQAAVTASLRASVNQGSIVHDAALAPLIARLTPDTSKALLVDVGRAVEIAAALSPARQAKDLEVAARLTRDMKVSVMTDEKPDQLTITADLTGLPRFGAIWSALGSALGKQGVAVKE